jgi:hypothetical protein
MAAKSLPRQDELSLESVAWDPFALMKVNSHRERRLFRKIAEAF